MKEITQAKIYYLKELQMSKFSDLEYASKNWLMTIPRMVMKKIGARLATLFNLLTTGLMSLKPKRNNKLH